MRRCFATSLTLSRLRTSPGSRGRSASPSARPKAVRLLLDKIWERVGAGACEESVRRCRSLAAHDGRRWTPSNRRGRRPRARRFRHGHLGRVELLDHFFDGHVCKVLRVDQEHLFSVELAEADASLVVRVEPLSILEERKKRREERVYGGADRTLTIISLYQ